MFAGRTLQFFFVFLLPFLALGTTCVNPQVKPVVYTTTEATSSMDTVFIVQFSLSCKTDAKGLNLYADINGRTLSVVQNPENKEFPYQVSYSDENKSLPAGKYDIKFYDEDGYSALRKAQRSGEDTSAVPTLFTIPVQHPGVWKGPLVPSEFVALAVAAAVFYSAYVTRGKLQSS